MATPNPNPQAAAQSSTPHNTPSSTELSGAHWCEQFPGSNRVEDLAAPFYGNCTAFLKALDDAGAKYSIAATYRPPQRAYLMRWSWNIAKGVIKPADLGKIPPMVGVAIQWTHPTEEASLAAAQAMVQSYGIDGLGVAPALKSRHTERLAIDMNISWAGVLNIAKKSGTISSALGLSKVKIESSPKMGMNPELWEVGKSYGVIKFVGGDRDKPHWSIDGH